MNGVHAYDLHDQIHGMGQGDHSCLIYDSIEQQMGAIVPFMKIGLSKNEFCVYIADDRSVDDIREALADGGIDVAAEESRGALVFATKRDTYVKSGRFDPEAMMDFLKVLVADALAKGFKGFRVTGEMTWALGNECGCHRLVEYEALLNDYFPASKASAICQYNQNRFDPEMIRDVLRTHPTAILGDEVCTNLYYETPDMVLGRAPIKDKVQWMIDQLRHFRKTERTLQHSVKLRDEFLSVASHELRTPLTSLKFQNSMLKEDLENTGNADREMLEFVSMNDRQIEKLANLVNDMLDSTRLNNGTLSFTPGHLDLSALVHRNVERARLESEKRCEIVLRADERVEGRWDELRLEQVVTNLLSNALKYGEGKPVHVRLARDQGEAVLTVTDHGGGIAELDQARVFEKFERAVAHEHVTGLGLGLYISRQIVESHGGRISVQSRLGEGSTFEVRLPLTA